MENTWFDNKSLPKESLIKSKGKKAELYCLAAISEYFQILSGLHHSDFGIDCVCTFQSATSNIIYQEGPVFFLRPPDPDHAQ